jgi:hypothetical protein
MKGDDRAHGEKRAQAGEHYHLHALGGLGLQF